MSYSNPSHTFEYRSSFIVISPQSQSPPPSAHTNHKPARQSAHQQSLSAAHKSLYLTPFSPRGISSGVRACHPPEKQVYRAVLCFLFHFISGHHGRLCKIHLIIFTIILRMYVLGRIGRMVGCSLVGLAALLPGGIRLTGASFLGYPGFGIFTCKSSGLIPRLPGLKLYAACPAFG